MSQRSKNVPNENKTENEEEASTSFGLPTENSGHDDPNVAEVVLSNKGGPKLIHNGYMYTLHKKQPYNIRWRCVSRSMHCRGSLITTSSCTKPRVRMEHNHKPDFAAAQVARKRYLALGKPCVLSSLEKSNSSSTVPMILKNEDLKSEQNEDQPKRRTARKGKCNSFTLIRKLNNYFNQCSLIKKIYRPYCTKVCHVFLITK